MTHQTWWNVLLVTFTLTGSTHLKVTEEQIRTIMATPEELDDEDPKIFSGL